MSKKDIDSKLLFIWNDDPFAEGLKQRFGELAVIISDSELQSKIDPEPDGVIVLAELTWNGYEPSQFYGFNVVRDLRAINKLLCPAIICSFMPLSYFSQSTDRLQAHTTCSNQWTSLLKAPAHKFVQLPFDPTRLADEMEPQLSEDLLDDIIESLCDTGGLVYEELHRLKHRVAGLVNRSDAEPSTEDMPSALAKCIDSSFNHIESLLPHEKTSLSKIKDNMFKTLSKEVIGNQKYDSAFGLVGSYLGEFESLFPEGSRKHSPPVEKTNWKALFIDDDENFRYRVKKAFESRGIWCEVAASGPEALDTLHHDKKNLITVVIADYRLEEGYNHKWQPMQGYTILKEIFTQKINMVAMFALTAAHRQMLLRRAEKYQMKVRIYSKDDIRNSNYDLESLAKRVRKEGEKMFEAICLQPTLTSWHEIDPKKQKNSKRKNNSEKKTTRKFKEPLKNYYRVHRLSIDYEDAEKYISDTAQQFVLEVIEADDYEYKTSPGKLNLPFQAGLRDGPHNPKMIKAFRQKLIGRRIALGLHLLCEKTREDIYDLLKSDKPARAKKSDDDSNSGGNTNISQLLDFHFALSLENDLPDHILIEERHWLKDAFGIDFNAATEKVMEEIQTMLLSLQDKLFDQCKEPFVKQDLEIQRLSDIQSMLDEALKAAKLCQQDCLFYDALEESWKKIKANKTLRDAFRVNGVEALYKKYKAEAGDTDGE